MGLFISSTSQVGPHGVYALSVSPPATIAASGTGVACLVAQTPWGPDSALYEPTSVADMLGTFWPRGCDRTVSSYLAATGKAFPTLKVVRVVGTGAAAATIIVSSSTPTALATFTMKYKGTLGNSVVCTVAAASDGNANHVNLLFTLTGPSGTTTDLLENFNVSGTGSDTVLDPTKLSLVGSYSKTASGVPATAASASGGSDGTVAAASYIGTAGTGDKGFAATEGDDTISAIFIDDCGSSLRAAVNAGLVLHAATLSSRVAFINGPSGQTLAQAQTDAATYTPSEYVMYCDAWVYQLDDTTGAKRLTPSAPFAASLFSQFPPSTSVAWKNTEMTAKLAGIVGLEFDRGLGVSSNTSKGIATFRKERNGGYAIEADVVTIAPSDPTRKRLRRTALGIYIAKSVTQSLRGYVDGPNVSVTQDQVVAAIDAFLDGMKRAATVDPAHNAYIKDYSISPIAATNTPTSLAAGQFKVEAQIQTDAGMEYIFFAMQYGETVTIIAK